MNKKDLKNLRAVAAKMPVYYQKTMIRRTGEEILKANSSAKEPNGTSIDVNKYYLEEVMMPTNHYRAMKKLFIAGGIDAVKKYISEIATLEHDVAKGQNDLLGGLAERKSMFQI